jgi:polyphenol oxidase
VLDDRVEVALDDGRRAVVVLADSTVGDLAATSDPAALAATRRRVVDLPWTWLTQVHGADVVRVTVPGEHAGAAADGAVTSISGAALAVQAADCAPIALVATAGAVGVVHAGWRGLLDGVVARAVAELRAEAGSDEVRAVLGPCIGPECYEFSPDDLDPLVDRFGVAVAGRTTSGAPALDVRAAAAAALAELDVPLDDAWAQCTSCGDGHWYSHRARRETGRHAIVVWIDAG